MLGFEVVVFCVKCGVIGLTQSKLGCLDHEFEGFQWWMQFGIDRDILSQQYNADLNGAKNILKRAEEQCFPAGALAYAQKPVADNVNWQAQITC